jgi:hypothetical protein
MSVHQQCAERAGFLFKHTCEMAGVLECGQCGKQICQKHGTILQDNRTLCVNCLKSSGRTVYQDHHYSPYFYGYCYYDGWGSYHHGPHYGHGGGEYHGGEDYGGHDSDDFTEADGGATEFEGDEGFETDMEGS